MVRTIIWLIFTALLLIIFLPFLFVMWIFRDRKETAGPNKAVAAVLKPLIWFLAKLAGAKVIVKGKENLPKEAALYVGNHQSNFDALIALSYLGKIKPIVLKKEMTKIPILNMGLQLLACIPLDRQNIRQSFKAIMVAAEKMKAGNSVIIFPEGTRSKGPEMNEFKNGAFKAAIDANVPIVIFVTDGSYKCFEEHNAIRAATIHLSILPPIQPEEYAGMKANDIGIMVQERIRTELSEMRKEYN